MDVGPFTRTPASGSRCCDEAANLPHSWGHRTPYERASDGDWRARTGQFRLGRDQLITGNDGKSAISYDDYAIALVDELERPQHIRMRFTIGY